MPKTPKAVKAANARAAKAAKAMAAKAAKALDGVAPAVPSTSPSNEVPQPLSQPEWLDPALTHPTPFTQPDFPHPALNDLIVNAAKIDGAMTLSEFLATHSVGSANSVGKQPKLPR